MGDALSCIIEPDDSRLVSEFVRLPESAESIRAYLSRPRDGIGLGSVLVIHENRGLTDHITDVARRFALEGFAAFAPDLLSRTGGTDSFPSPAEAVEAIKRLTPQGVEEDLNNAMVFLKEQPFANGRIGVVGFCWGGAHSLNFATKCGDLKAAVVYYGRNPASLDQIRNLACPILGLYGEEDEKIMPGVEPLRAALKRYGKSFDIRTYPGAKHAFNNNTNTDRYHPEAAKDAWEKTVLFLKTHLAT